MRSLLIILSVVGVAIARPGYLGLGLGARSLLHAPLAYSSVAAPLAYSSVAAPVTYTVAAPAPVAHAISSQYHAQDELGQYSYGYSGGPSAKSEVKTFDGITRGGYSYVDANGKVQTVNYVSDPVNGFRVAATNLPVAPEATPAEPLVAPTPVEDTPEVASAKVAHRVAFDEAAAAAEAAPDVPVADEPEAVEVASVAVAPADLLPASVLSRNVEGVLSPAYAPAHAYGAISPYSYGAISPYSYGAISPYSYGAISPYSYSAIAPAVAPAPITYHSAVAPVSRFAYSAAAPAVSYAHHPISYTAAVTPAAYSYHAAAPAIAPAHITYAAPHSITSQYHAQDELGQYSYGYSGGPSSKSEIKTFDGVTRGGYSYVDAEGKIQTVNYISDPINGFRVAATNLPVAPAAPALETIHDTAEVAALKAEHLVAVEEAKTRLQSA